MPAIDEMTQKLASAIKEQLFIEVEASGRHIHLNRSAIDHLFGVGYQLKPVKELSQPGQYVCEERLTISGAKGSLARVVVLGPERPNVQVEISMTDALLLGIDAPIRQSGDIKNSASVTISSEKAEITISEGLIIASRHIHMTPEDAHHYQLKDGDLVNVKVFGKRPVIFQDTLVRVSDRFRTRMHIDYDEANACGFTKGTFGRILQESLR